MIVLDTNVVSEIMRKAPEPAVMAWLNGLDANEVYLTSTVTGELLLGAARLPIGARQRLLQDSVQEILTVDFVGKILSFDWLAAQHYALLVAQAQQTGKAIHIVDAYIAAVCLATGATLATRNVKHFMVPGLKVLNPWG